MYERLNAHDIFSATYLSLHMELLDPNKLAKGNLRNFIKKIETLSPDEKAVLIAYGSVALSKKHKVKKEYVRKTLEISAQDLDDREDRIYSKLNICSLPQLALASYVLVKYVANKQSSRLPDATILQPA